MGIKEKLLAYAANTAKHFSASVPRLKKEALDLKAEHDKKQLELNAANMALQRANDFGAALGTNLFCPDCWLAGREPSVLRFAPSGPTGVERYRCPSPICRSEFDAE